jgi:ATP/maltotriose-dependent transcriptional regulator MalT
MVDGGVPTLPDLSHPRAGSAVDLIASKLRRPPTRPGTIRRASLIERLTRDDSHPIVSVIAPPGYGKGRTAVRAEMPRKPARGG